MVLGLILIGLATPTEAAASGVIGTLVVMAGYGSINLKILKKSFKGTLEISIMIFMIITASKTFSNLLAFTGTTHGLLSFISALNVPPLIVLIFMMITVLFLGTFMETISIMMICLPIYMPIIDMLGFNPLWFGVLMLINLEVGMITPPFGMLLFVMKSVAPWQIEFEKICWAAFPFIMCDILAMAIIIAYPPLVLWLPKLAFS